MFNFRQFFSKKIENIAFDIQKYYPINGNGGVIVNSNSAMKLSAVYACVRLISQTIASLPFRVYENGADGRKVAARNPIDKLINRKPNETSTAFLFWSSIVASILLRGGAYIEVTRIGPRPMSMKFLTRDRLTIYESAGIRTYRYVDWDGVQRDIPATKIVYFPGFSLDGRDGLSAIEYGSAVFGSAIAGNTAANNSFENGLQPTMYLKNPSVVNREQRDAFRESMQTVMGALNAGTPVVLEGGQELGTIGINQKDAQLLESRQFSIEEICRWFGVPPSMIGHTGAATAWGSGIEQLMIGFLTFTLTPILIILQQTINADIIPDSDSEKYFADHVTQGLMRADSTARSAYYGAMTNNGIMTRDEARTAENLPTKGGNAEVLTVQSALVPLNNLGVASNV